MRFHESFCSSCASSSFKAVHHVRHTLKNLAISSKVVVCKLSFSSSVVINFDYFWFILLWCFATLEKYYFEFSLNLKAITRKMTS